MVTRPPRRRKPRSAWRTAGWALATVLGVCALLVMLVLSVSDPLEGEGDARGKSEAGSSSRSSSGGEDPDLSGPAWVTAGDSAR